MHKSKIFSKIIKQGFRTYYPQGKYIFYRGDIGNDFYIIQKGSVELSVFDLEGDKMILSELKIGDFFGQVEIFTNGIRPTNAYVNAGTELISFSSSIIRSFIRENREEAVILIEDLCSIINDGVEKIEDALVLSAYQKVSKKLYELSQKNNSKYLQISQKRMAEFLAISERTTNTSLQKLKKIGAIEMARARIKIIDDDKLINEFSGGKEVA